MEERCFFFIPACRRSSYVQTFRPWCETVAWCSGKSFWLGISVCTLRLRRTTQLPFTRLSSDTGIFHWSRLFVRKNFREKYLKKNTFLVQKVILAALPLLCLWLIFTLRVTGSDLQMVKTCSKRTGWMWPHGGPTSHPCSEDFSWSNDITISNEWIEQYVCSHGSSEIQTSLVVLRIITYSRKHC